MKFNLGSQLSLCGLVAVTLMCGACGSDPTVAMVKGGSLQSCPNSTVEQMVNGFMGSPSWESAVGENSVKLVSIGGDITFAEKPVRAVVQFVVDEKAGSFEYQALELNGVPQNNLMAATLMSNMCASAKSAETSGGSSSMGAARSQVLDALHSAGDTKASVTEVYALTGAFPESNKELDLPESLKTTYADIEVVTGGAIDIAFNDNSDSSLHGGSVRLVPTVASNGDVEWSCGGSGVPRESLPKACR